MRIGKLENSELEALILNKFKRIRPESLTVPRVGEDCAALDFHGDLIVMSMDPITILIGQITYHLRHTC